MIVGYDLSHGGIVFTVDGETDIDAVGVQEGQGKLVTLVEHGSGIRNLRVDLETKTLVPKSAIIFKPDKHEIAAGESVIVEFLHEGEQFGDHFPLRVNHETVLAIPYNEPQIELTLELPGEYVLSIPDLRIHSIPQRIRVKESLQ